MIVMVILTGGGGGGLLLLILGLALLVALMLCPLLCRWFREGEADPFHQPAFRVEVMDTTGCGDVFHGILLAALTNGQSTREAAEEASAGAALAATALGGRGFLPTRSEVRDFLAASPPVVESA